MSPAPPRHRVPPEPPPARKADPGPNRDSDERAEDVEARLDEILEESFPASDSPAWSSMRIPDEPPGPTSPPDPPDTHNPPPSRHDPPAGGPAPSRRDPLRKGK